LEIEILNEFRKMLSERITDQYTRDILWDCFFEMEQKIINKEDKIWRHQRKLGQ
jgi:hypothetical protein